MAEELQKEKREKRDYFQEVTNEIIAAMEKGNIPWQKPWDPEVGGNLCPKPFNGKSGRAYTLDNAVRCLIIMGEKNSSDPRFFTFLQAQQKGWKVKKGAKSLCVRQGFYATKDAAGNNLPKEECHWTNQYIHVFHASDVCQKVEYVKDENGKTVYENVMDENGKPIMVDDLDTNGKPKSYEIVYDEDGQMIFGKNGRPLQEPAKKFLQQPKVIYTPIPEFVPKATFQYTHEETMELAEAVLQKSGAKIQHISSDRAFYEKNSDIITLPPKGAFPTLAGYYATALHELAHWTGHESRLHRNMSGDQTSQQYAREELRAELASVYLAMELGVPVNTTQNAAYVQSWIQNLKEDKKEIFNAMNDAMKITSYIKELAKDKIKEITMAKTEKKEEPEIPIVNEPKQEVVSEVPIKESVSEPQNKTQEEKDNEIRTKVTFYADVHESESSIKKAVQDLQTNGAHRFSELFPEFCNVDNFNIKVLNESGHFKNSKKTEVSFYADVNKNNLQVVKQKYQKGDTDFDTIPFIGFYFEELNNVSTFDINILNIEEEKKLEKDEKIKETPEESRNLSQNGIDVVEPREVGQKTENTEKPKIEEAVEQPEPQLPLFVVTVYNPKDGQFGKEFDSNSNEKFKLNDFERQSPILVLDASSPADYFAKHNTHAVGSLVQVDDELFYINKNNHFKRIYATNVNGETLIQQAANPAKFIENAVGKVGQENFDNYKEKFLEVFRIGAGIENPEMAKENLESAYSKFVYDNAIKFGLSSNNPIGSKQWKNANEAFMEACIKEFGANEPIMELASKTVKDICPMKVSSDSLKESTLKSELYQKFSAKENKNVQIAAYGAR